MLDEMGIEAGLDVGHATVSFSRTYP